MATFVVFAIIAAVKQNETLLTAQAFTAFALISLLTTPVLTFIQAVPSIIQCVGSFNRIQEFCSVPASSSMASADLVTPTSSLQGLASSTNGLANAHDSCTELQLIAPIMLDQFITFVDCDFAWKKGQEAVLKHINLDISMKTFTFIVGPVGSGKSSILACMLGESLQLRGRVSRNEASISYCAQTAWLQNTSIRSNIIGPAEYEEDWYATVVRACALDEDLSAMPDGDQTNVGSSGNNLSGGQRQRVVSNSTSCPCWFI